MRFDWSVIWDNLGLLGEGAELNVFLAVVTMALAIPGGLLLAFLRLSGFRRSRILQYVLAESTGSTTSCRCFPTSCSRRSRPR